MECNAFGVISFIPRNSVKSQLVWACHSLAMFSLMRGLCELLILVSAELIFNTELWSFD